MFKYEIYKLLIKRKMILILFFAIILKLLLLLSGYDVQINKKMEYYKAEYTEYLNNVNSRLTEETERYIADEKAKLNNARESYNNALKALAEGTINQSEFMIISQKSKEALSNENAFNIFLSEYEYVKVEPKKRCFLYTNGWSAMFGSEKLDILLIIMLIFISTSIFSQEYDTDMYYMLKTCKNGRSKLFNSKLTLSLTLSIVLSALFFAVELIFYSLKYGLPSGEFPIQSISQFSDSTYNISLSELAKITCICRSFASLYLTIILVLGIVIFKKASATFFLVFTICILPYFIFESGKIRYLIPTPLGYYLSIGFCQATIKDKLNNEIVLNISSYQTVTITLISIITMIVYVLLSYKKYCQPERKI